MIYLLTGVALLALASGCTKAIIDETPTNDPDRIITYDADIGPLINNWCTTCHGGSAPAAGIALTSYGDVKFQAESGTLIERMNSSTNPMPPSGQLSADDLALINKWVTDGYQQ